MGGDLADLVIDGRDVIAYVADVSGHGMRVWRADGDDQNGRALRPTAPSVHGETS